VSDAVAVFARTGLGEAGPVVRIASRVVRASAGRIIQLRLSCPQEAVVCHGTISLKANGRVVGRGGFAVAGGTTGPAEARLSKRGRALLAKHGRLATTVTVVARDAQGPRTHHPGHGHHSRRLSASRRRPAPSSTASWSTARLAAGTCILSRE
jgi:hypothetical protein